MPAPPGDKPHTDATATGTAALSADQLTNLAIRALGVTQNRETIAIAVAIALAESGGITTKVSTTGDYGLWQINHRAHPTYSTAKLLSDPFYNAQAMASISHGGTDWSAWTAYKNGSYKAHLDTARGAVGPAHEVGAVNAAVNAAEDAATKWVRELIAGASKSLLGLVIVTAGLGVAALGLARITHADDKAGQIFKAASTASGAAALVP